MELAEKDLPALYRAADKESQNAQTTFLRLTRAELICVVAAAGFGALTIFANASSFFGALSVIAFLSALIARLYGFKIRPERAWYEGRAVAESAKNLAWRYSVGAEPFCHCDVTTEQADSILTDRLRSVISDMNNLAAPTTSGEDQQITPAMQNLRNSSLEERKAAYRTKRIEDQQDWYSKKANWNKSRAAIWNWVLIAFEVLGVVAAVCQVAGFLHISLAGLFGAAVAAGVSWLQTKQHYNLSKSYSVAAQELSMIKAKISSKDTERSWSEFVTDAEDAISREHTLWKASRVG